MPAVRLALALVLVLGAAYVAYTYHAYNRVQAKDRPCRGCAAIVTINGYDLYYRELGVDRGRPPVIVVHGGPGHSSLSFKDSFDFLSTETRVIYYDQRGSGNSQLKSQHRDYTIEQLVEELEVLRRDVVRTDTVVLVGHSFGSALVQRYALKYPARVDRLVLVAGIRINNSMNSRFVWQWFGPALYATALGLPPPDADAADDWLSRDADASDRLFDKSRKDLLIDAGRLSFVPWREISRSLTGYDYRAELSRLQAPVLFIYGTADSDYTGKPVAAELCAIVPKCQATGFEQSGHWPFLEEPQRFRKAINEFLAR